VTPGARDAGSVENANQLGYSSAMTVYRYQKSAVGAAILALSLGGCASQQDALKADPVAKERPAETGLASATSDRLLLAASSKAASRELASTETPAVTRRPRNDTEEVGASLDSTSWKVNRDPKNGQGELCAVQNYYLAPKPVR